MATLSVQNMSDEDGAAIGFVAAGAGGDVFAWSDRTFLAIRNNSAGTLTVTLTAQATQTSLPAFGELIRDNIVLAVAASAVALIPPPPRAFRNASGMVAVSYSGVTDLQVAAARF